ncbi:MULTISPECIES: cobyrinate a,c-diamide synthase [Candidatus Nitrosocaldus]|jgi:cobyrinic acid a,c-diamide synthase|uniref:Cobyrinate a,c-diamide synthase n=1 Tax=Candidatus Nitrosocaldus cavascurensis TaxID=2058097 RepID=A0A2K5AT67_9ARCH|nr:MULTISPECIES: cobyrinate a,c-diamide synthase [Candidatus Nitrosocaldus]SPC34804.1 Cobyrinate a,c-diamide synthase [Candidatus Nitrosocaldus cavascurensis]
MGIYAERHKHARVVIAGTNSGVGKTSITIGLMHALTAKGYRVQGFKVGPDYIDPSYHTSITGIPSRNLDPWLMGEDNLLESFINAMRSSNADVAVIEGVMGLYDGLSGMDDYASTAHVATLLDSPVILVIDASKAARSVAAMALGFIEFNRAVKVKGVILNNVAGDRHAKYCSDALEQKGIPVFGVVRRNKDIMLKERHLGLVPTHESRDAKDDALATARYVSEHINADGIIAVAEGAPALKHTSMEVSLSSIKDHTITVGVALDESFNFYYADNLEMLSRYARVVYFSPIKDEEPPECDGLYIGGGFPEVLAEMLARNSRMMRRIKEYAEDGMPVYAECGGLMYLSRSITDQDGSKHDMVGLVDADTIMDRRLTLNYTEARISNPCILAEHGSMVRGHEFHYSTLVDIARDSRFAYEMLRGKGVDGSRDGFIVHNTLASYMHLHFSRKNLVERFIASCKRYSTR